MIKNLFLLVVVCAAVLFGGKYYIEQRYEKEIDKAVRLYGVPVSYKDVKLDFDGSLALNGLKMTMPDRSDDIRYGQIKLSSSDRFAFVKGSNMFKKGKFPEDISIKINDMQFSSDLIDYGPKSKHCRSIETTLMYSILGQERVYADMDVSIDRSDPYNSVIDIYYSDPTGTFDLQFVLDIEGVLQAAQGGSDAAFEEVTFKSELDPAVSETVVAYCADLFKISGDEFLEKVVGSSKYSSNSFGVDLGPAFREALTKYMRGGVAANVRSEPSNQLSTKQLVKLAENDFKSDFFKPRDVLRWLNLSVFIDGNLVPTTIVEEKIVEKKSDKKPARRLAKYESVSVGQVARYVDHDVRVSRTKGRKPIRGRLLSAKNGLLAIESYRFSGVMTLKVAVGDVSKLEVLTRGDSKDDEATDAEKASAKAE